MNNISLNYKNNNRYQARFKGNNPAEQLSLGYKAAKWFVSTHESSGGLSHIRFIQDTTTNWFPKTFLSRSKADFVESTFLEYSESALFYYAPGLLGEKVLRPLFSKLLPNKNLKNLIATPAEELIKKKSSDASKVLPIKAGIVLGCAAIPLSEYALSFAKNLLTLKLFKKADFSNIVALNKEQKEDPTIKERVQTNADKHIKKSAVFAGASLAAGVALAAFGPKSKALQKLSGVILQPGAKLYNLLEKTGIKSNGLKEGLNKYLSLDFANSNGKLCLSHGQLTVSVLSGLYGYLSAAKDRGKLDFLETASRVPLVAVYTIFGSSALEHYFKKFLHKYKNKDYKNLIVENKKTKELEVPSLQKIKEMAKATAQASNGKTTEAKEFKKLLKGKAIIAGGPYLFSLIAMGFILSALNRYWTAKRYKNGIGRTQEAKQTTPLNTQKNNLFKNFQTLSTQKN